MSFLSLPLAVCLPNDVRRRLYGNVYHQIFVETPKQLCIPFVCVRVIV